MVPFMLRILARLIGLLLLAGGFISLVVDGTRSIAGGRLAVTSLHRGLSEFEPALFESLRVSVAQKSEWLWDPVTTNLLTLPVSLAFLGLGALLILISARREAQRRYWRR
jgi:hypothetical protein